MSIRGALVLAMTLCACGDRSAPLAARRSPVETGIARELAARFGVPVTARCSFVLTTPYHCEARVADRTVLPIRVRSRGAAWEWELEGRVVEAAPIAAYVQAVLGDLHVAQTVSCGPVVQRLAVGERLACPLSGGGMAFVDVHADGTLALELAIDPAVAAVRAEPARDVELAKTSLQLEWLQGQVREEDDEEAPRDGGAAGP